MYDKYRQSPILQRKWSEVLQMQSMVRCLWLPHQDLPPKYRKVSITSRRKFKLLWEFWTTFLTLMRGWLIHIINKNNLWVYLGANNQYWWCKVVKLRSGYEWTNDKQAIFTTKEDTEPLDLSLLNISRKIIYIFPAPEAFKRGCASWDK